MLDSAYKWAVTWFHLENQQNIIWLGCPDFCIQLHIQALCYVCICLYVCTVGGTGAEVQWMQWPTKRKYNATFEQCWKLEKIVNCTQKGKFRILDDTRVYHTDKNGTLASETILELVSMSLVDIVVSLL